MKPFYNVPVQRFTRLTTKDLEKRLFLLLSFEERGRRPF